ncbi:hypothetical protein AMTR_s00004p00225050 [Amborella trichopoda]|uniref:Dirigent protein n=1 Tax=Amborella trichopoda TaxID=13333 RepID=W1NEA0_AMBTC|nr:hypothetical protein AMTR_s00004p00225050 [Amborella trichopoda]
MARSDVEVCSILFFFFILHSVGAYYRHTVKRLILYFHNIIYDGTNAQKVTSTLVGAPQGANLTRLTGNNHFGDLVVFDDPITLHNNLHSSPVGRAQGMYLYDKKDTFTSWLGSALSSIQQTTWGHLTSLVPIPYCKKPMTYQWWVALVTSSWGGN